MKEFKKINLASLADKEIKKNQLSELKGGEMDILPCACFRQDVRVRSMGNRRAYPQ